MKPLKSMPVLYVAGRYRDDRGDWFVRRNIQVAALVARELWSFGVAVLCPHANSAGFGGTDIPDKTFLDGDLEMLSRCDGIVMIPGWRESLGAKAEMRFADRAGLPVFHWPVDREALEAWIERWGEEGRRRAA